MRYKLLALDLDGTALGSDPDAFAPGLAEAAAAAAERGCIVAGGHRAPCGVPARRPGPGAGLDAMAGAGRRGGGDRPPHRRAPLAAGLWRRQPVPGGAGGPAGRLPGRVHRRGQLVPCGPGRPPDAGELAGCHPLPQRVLARRGRPLEGPAAGLACRDILKINALLVPGPARDAFFAEVEGAALAMDCGGGAIELTAPGAGKLAAVTFLAGRLGLTLQDVMAIGGQRQRRGPAGRRRAGGGHGQRARPRPAGGPGRHRPQHRGRRGASHPPLAAGRIKRFDLCTGTRHNGKREK